MSSSSEAGSYLRLVDFCITQLQAESNKKEEEDSQSAAQREGSNLSSYTSQLGDM